jgi:DNA-binding transcriptional LysR family regulator
MTFKNENVASLDDILLFVAVVEAGSLAGAARRTGASMPTLSRRMSQLERRLGRRLFQRGGRGYVLTSDGQTLMEDAAPLRALADRLRRFSDRDGPARVRITAGMWTSRFLAGQASRLCPNRDVWLPEFLPSDATLDIARRAADIGVRNRRPDQTWLAGRKTGLIDYAAFAASDDVTGWVTLPFSESLPPSQAWVHGHAASEIVTTASDMRVVLDLARAGLGMAVLPFFAGAAESGLRQVSAPIKALQHEEWLVSHHEARQDPPIRAALDAVHAVLTNRSLRPAH